MACKTVITFGDFLLFPPIPVKPVYMLYTDTWQNFESQMKNFKIAELTEVIRMYKTKRDAHFN